MSDEELLFKFLSFVANDSFETAAEIAFRKDAWKANVASAQMRQKMKFYSLPFVRFGLHAP